MPPTRRQPGVSGQPWCSSEAARYIHTKVGIYNPAARLHALSALFVFLIMNRVNPLTSFPDVPMPRTLTLRELFTSLARFLWGSDELPNLLPQPCASKAWIITARLSQETSFGTVSTRPAFSVEAHSEREAFRIATSSIKQAYPGYTVTFLEVEPSLLLAPKRF